MNSFMSWVGGKKALREEIVRRFPLSYERYIEVFGGGGWVLFHKPPGRDFEVYNDFNSLLANLYRCVRDRHEELIDSLRYVLNSREDFELIKQALARDNVNLPEGQREDALGRSPASDVQKASWFYQIIRYSYAVNRQKGVPFFATRDGPICATCGIPLSISIPFIWISRNCGQKLPEVWQSIGLSDLITILRLRRHLSRMAMPLAKSLTDAV